MQPSETGFQLNGKISTSALRHCPKPLALNKQLTRYSPDKTACWRGCFRRRQRYRPGKGSPVPAFVNESMNELKTIAGQSALFLPKPAARRDRPADGA